MPASIVGVSCRLPGKVHDLDSLWEVLLHGKADECITQVPSERWNIDRVYSPDSSSPGTMSIRKGGWLDGISQFDPAFFGISEEEATYVRPTERLILEGVWHALEDAGIPPSSLRGKRVSIHLATSSEDGFDKICMVNRGLDGLAKVDSPQRSHDGIPDRLQKMLGVKGPAMIVQTACSSSHSTIHYGIQALDNNEVDIAICGGVTLHLWPSHFSFLSQGGMSSKQGRCAAFSEDADGYVPSEGAAFVVLKRQPSVQDRVHGIIRASTMVHTGRAASLSAPSEETQVRLFSTSLEKAGLSPSDITLIEAHGTGTPAGDPIELHALSKVYSGSHLNRDKLIITSSKTIFGHTEEISGLVGLFKVILAFKKNLVAPHLHLKQLRSDVDVETIPAIIPTSPYKFEATESRIAIINSFGFAGTLCSLVVEEPAKNEESNPMQLGVITASARSPWSLNKLVKGYSDVKFDANKCYTSNIGRENFQYRAAWAMGQQPPANLPASPCVKPRRIAFLCPGQGSQRVNMAIDLYKTSAIFRDSMNACNEVIHRLLGYRMLDLLYPKDGVSTPYTLEDTIVSQPLLLSLTISLAKVWKSFGLQPDILLGHSVGEIAAAHFAGALTETQALEFICKRAQCLQPKSESRAAGMAAVALPEQDVIEAIALLGSQVSIAAVNGPQETVISGYLDEVAAVQEAVKKDGAKTTLLRVKQAFHSEVITDLLPELKEWVDKQSFSAAKLPFISTVTGQQYSQPLDGLYWATHARSTVRFYDAVSRLPALEVDMCIELGEGILSNLITKSKIDIRSVIPSINSRSKDGIPGALAKAYMSGVDIDFRGLYPTTARLSTLPPYPFEQRHFWPDTEDDSETAVMKKLYSNVNPSGVNGQITKNDSKHSSLVENSRHVQNQTTKEPILARNSARDARLSDRSEKILGSTPKAQLATTPHLNESSERNNTRRSYKGVAIVTGVTGAIGGAIAEELLETGYRTSIWGRDKSKMATLAKEYAAKYSSDMVDYAALDLLDEEAVKTGLERVNKTFGTPTVLIHAAGLWNLGNAKKASLSKWSELININLIAVMRLTRMFLAMCLSNGTSTTLHKMPKPMTPETLETKGTIVFITSLASREIFPNNAAYVASKHGLLGFAKSVFMDTRDDGIKVCALSPGVVLAGNALRLSQESQKRFMAPSDVAAAIRYILSSSVGACPTEITLETQLTTFPEGGDRHN